MEPPMNADERRIRMGELPINELTERVIGAAYAVHNELGCGFLEKVYENAMLVELRHAGLTVAQQHPITIEYQGVVVGDYQADLLVDGRLIVELKATKAIDDTHIAQTINYLRATQRNIGLLLNFGTPKLQIKRLVHNLQEPS